MTEFTNEELLEIRARPTERTEQVRYQEQMARHHNLGALTKIGETVWYFAIWREQWVAQMSLSAALKCGVRDCWIGWDNKRAAEAALPVRTQAALGSHPCVALSSAQVETSICLLN